MTQSQATVSTEPADVEQYLHMYHQMVRIREFEEKVNELYTHALMPGLAHLYIGEEAVAVGVCEALRRDDYITSTHRGHGHCLAKGAAVDRMFAELLGKEAGYCHGKGGSMHIADPETGNLGANAIVGGSAGIATGAALSAKRLGTGQVAVCFFGEGALGQGLLYEEMNLAQLWRLPVIYVCENNQYNEYTHYSETTAGDISARAKAFGLLCEDVDGQDVRAVYAVMQRLVDRARRGEGPAFLQCHTYRYRGHHVGDINRGYYRTKEEEEEWSTTRDPIQRLADWLTGAEHAGAVGAHPVVAGRDGGRAPLLGDPAVLDRIHSGVKAEIEAGVQFALNAPFPDASEVDQHVYA
jgi:pyruvate dehydrogenase E1 component alpha subunit